MDVKSVLVLHVKSVCKGTPIQISTTVNQFVVLTVTIVLLQIIVKAAKLFIVLTSTQIYANSIAV